MRQLFAGELPRLGLHVFVPDFQAKATNLIRNLAGDRTRLIQAVLTCRGDQPGARIEDHAMLGAVVRGERLAQALDDTRRVDTLRLARAALVF